MSTNRSKKLSTSVDRPADPPRFSMMKGTIITPGRLDAFIEAIATGSEDKEACEFAGVTLQAIRARQRSDIEFAKAYKAARAARIEVYRSEARRRAVDGWAEPVFYRGEQVGRVRKHSDRMLEVLLKAEDPDTFGDRKVVEILTTPMTGADVARAVEVGKLEGAADALEAVARLFAAKEVIEAVALTSSSDEEDDEP